MKSHSSHSENKTTPSINYLWIGPPAQIAGHDIGGPIEMAEQDQSQPVVFWCLEKHKKYYDDKFKQYKNIIVKSAEEFVKAGLDHESKSATEAELVKQIMDVCLGGDRGAIRDYVTVKEAFSLYLLQSVDGYILDSNVLPVEQEVKREFSHRDAVSFPVLQSPPKKHNHLDCWMMYGPKGNQAASKILKLFHTKWWEREQYRAELLEQRKDLKDYYSWMSSVITESIFAVYQNDGLGLIDTRSDKDKLFIDVPELGLHKTYSNTHKYEMRSKYEPNLFGAKGRESDTKLNEIFYLAAADNVPQLKVFIKHGGDINDQVKAGITGFYEGETPLHIAIRYQKLNALKELLTAGAKLDLKAKYPAAYGELTAGELAERPEYSKCKEILDSFANSQKKTI